MALAAQSAQHTVVEKHFTAHAHGFMNQFTIIA
jgi:hypothetical protein